MTTSGRRLRTVAGRWSVSQRLAPIGNRYPVLDRAVRRREEAAPVLGQQRHLRQIRTFGGPLGEAEAGGLRRGIAGHQHPHRSGERGQGSECRRRGRGRARCSGRRGCRAVLGGARRQRRGRSSMSAATSAMRDRNERRQFGRADGIDACRLCGIGRTPVIRLAARHQGDGHERCGQARRGRAQADRRWSPRHPGSNRPLDETVRQLGDDQGDGHPQREQCRCRHVDPSLVEDDEDRPVEQVHAVADLAQPHQRARRQHRHQWSRCLQADDQQRGRPRR